MFIILNIEQNILGFYSIINIQRILSNKTYQITFYFFPVPLPLPGLFSGNLVVITLTIFGSLLELNRM